MIGLGSNRLSVCRRGGMRVTQAGRGGMVWLAGWREPLWASPYSAQATAALLAQFTTQWPTIWDYGFAHPEYINAINLYAPTDPYIVLPLIPEIGQERYIQNSGMAYINTGLSPYGYENLDFEVEVSWQNFNSYDKALFACYGSSVAGSGIYGLVYHTAGTSQGVAFMAGRHNAGAKTGLAASIAKTTISGKKTASELVAYVNGAQTGTGTIGTLVDKPIWIFVPNGHYYSSYNSVYKLYQLKFTSGNNVVKHFVPCKYNGQDGMLDLINAEWKGNANSAGSFTISEPTPAS